MMEIRKMKIDSEYVDVATIEEYARCPQIYDGQTAIMVEGYALPIIPVNDTRSIGIRVGAGLVMPYNLPQTEEDKEKYSLDNMIDMSHPENYQEVVEKTMQMRATEREILSTVDNKTSPTISPKDTPQMAALKTAIDMKNMDIDSYAHRFGSKSNYANNKRLLCGQSANSGQTDISLKKLVQFGNALDMKITLTIEDASPDVPNPMGHPISTVITSNREAEIEDE